MPIACGASKKADINWRMLIQPQAVTGSKGLSALGRRSLSCLVTTPYFAPAPRSRLPTTGTPIGPTGM